MTERTTRRAAIKGMGIATASVATSAQSAVDPERTDESVPLRWSEANDRVWLGPEFWANPMEDWCIRDGAAECLSGAGGRNVHWITKRIEDASLGFETSVTVEQVQTGKENGGFGFRVGVRSEIDEYRSNCFSNGGIVVGIRGGNLVCHRQSIPVEFAMDEKLTLRLTCNSPAGMKVRLQASLFAENGQLLATVGVRLQADSLTGNICLVNNFNSKSKASTRYRFSHWLLEGEGVREERSLMFGPVLWTMYTLNDSRGSDGFILRLTALMAPVGKNDNANVQLQTRVNGSWVVLKNSEIDSDAYTATFELKNWDETQNTDYRITYQEKDGCESSAHYYGGRIRANPSSRPLRMAALTCQKDYAFPYEPVANNVVKLDPDLIYFSGDQLYEGHGGFGLIREPAERAILNYLRKFYMFGWAFGDCMRNAPTICIPDDHDVFQGNIWGESGARMKDISGGASSKGGYREPARMVNVVHRTNASHHPRPFDATPVKQGISVYYGALNFGNVSFAILSDRQFKSGPTRVDTGSGRADHVTSPEFDTSKLDKEGLVLLGQRQEDFLRNWSEDWGGHNLKVVLSQTVFAGIATHHGKYDGYLKADLDSGGWPQTARNRAIEILAKAKPLHINGDQHLTSLAQYGVKKQRDAFWSFCTPAIAAGYPRWWRPDDVGMPHQNRPKHKLDNTGEYRDGLGNLVYVYAVGNPDVGTERNRYELAHQKGSGFGFVTMDTAEKTYRIESFRFLCDPTDNRRENQFEGWPLVISQADNGGVNGIG